MTQRRKGSAGWSTKTYKGPLWKVFHPGKYLKSEARKAGYHMRPDRVLWRVFGPGSARPSLKTKTTKVNAGTRQADVQRAAKKTAAAQKKTTAKKDPYAAALAIPARNRQAAAKMAKAAAPKKQVARRKTDGSGRFDGSKSMNERDLAAWQRAQGGAVDPVLLPRAPRRRGSGSA